MKQLKVAWFSAGVSSFIATYLAKDVDKIIYIDIADQHPDSMRFVKDCERVLHHEIEILQSPLKSVENACLSFGYINSPYGAKCTEVLKKRVRKQWENEHQDYDITFIWGMDLDEKHRAERLVETMDKFKHEFPLIDNSLTKADCHAICERLGVKRPLMYDFGYNNNNCIGCVKGGMGYWNKIRKDFPEVFNARAKMERKIGASCLNGVYLDELDPDRGNASEEVMQDCGIFCELALRK